MSLDRSLKSASSLVRHRNVLTRPERLLKLAELNKWSDDKSPLGLVKVANRKQVLAGKEKVEATADGVAAPVVAGAKAGTPAPGAKAAAPAAGAKGAAPAAKPAAKPAGKK